MAYDTIKLKSPPLDRQLVGRIEQQCVLRSGEHMATGEVLYEIFSGELLGSWDARISVVPKYEDYFINKSGRPELRPCEPYLLIEASVHKIFFGHNVYGGPTNFVCVCRDFVALVEKLLETELPFADTLRRWRMLLGRRQRHNQADCRGLPPIQLHLQM